jgi:hypothetical protein
MAAQPHLPLSNGVHIEDTLSLPDLQFRVPGRQHIDDRRSAVVQLLTSLLRWNTALLAI